MPSTYVWAASRQAARALRTRLILITIVMPVGSSLAVEAVWIGGGGTTQCEVHLIGRFGVI